MWSSIRVIPALEENSVLNEEKYSAADKRTAMTFTASMGGEAIRDMLKKIDIEVLLAAQREVEARPSR